MQPQATKQDEILTPTWKTFCYDNILWWKGSSFQKEHPLSNHTLEQIEESDELTHQEMSALKKLNTSTPQTNCVTIDSQLPFFGTLHEKAFQHIAQIIENIHPTDQVEGSVEHFARNLAQKNKTQDFLQLSHSDILAKQRAYLCLLTDNPKILEQIQNKDFLIFVSKPGLPVPDTIKKRLPVTQYYPYEHAEDPDLCLNNTNIQPFNADRDYSFENHWPPDCGLPFDDMGKVCSVVIIQKNFPKSPIDVIMLRKEWFSFLNSIVRLSNYQPQVYFVRKDLKVKKILKLKTTNKHKQRKRRQHKNKLRLRY